MAIAIPLATEAMNWATAIGFGAVGLALSIQKLLKVWANGRTDINKAEGENQVVLLLREELGRIACQNKLMDAKLSELHVAINALHAENYSQRITINQMEKEISLLKDQLLEKH